jgi:AraC-like DNA-binding protein
MISKRAPSYRKTDGCGHKAKLRRPSQIGAEDSLWIRALGIRERMTPGLEIRPYGTADYLFMFFFDPALIGVGDALQKAPRNSLFIWPQGVGHRYGNPDQFWRHSWIHCQGKVINDLLKNYRIPLNAILSFPDPMIFERYLWSFYREMTQYVRDNSVLLNNTFHNFIIEIARTVNTEDRNAKIPPHIINIKASIDSHFAEQMRISRLSLPAPLTPIRLNQEFKRYTGFTPRGYLTHLRMMNAALLLENSDLRIGRIAAKVGYIDVYHFSALFKKHHGVSPKKYREIERMKN